MGSRGVITQLGNWLKPSDEFYLNPAPGCAEVTNENPPPPTTLGRKQVGSGG